jgi:hypothetical protein
MKIPLRGDRRRLAAAGTSRSIADIAQDSGFCDRSIPIVRSGTLLAWFHRGIEALSPL